MPEERKDIVMLTAKNRALLKGLANHLKPQINLGKGEIDQNVISSIDQSLEAHELIKVKVLQNSNELCKDLAKQITEKTSSELVDIIGHTIILYRPSKKNPRIVL
ncbi:MAG TPA: ribosome assembly RNA-binding protein YhbY [Firmicutes bacterium]|nr:ribosome assembly RNA-binding protein YhbY [Bacillota bacterium]HBN00880.1 ribosome assembly RNA-binding protein YhbY [Bacillota bacterium]